MRSTDPLTASLLRRARGDGARREERAQPVRRLLRVLVRHRLERTELTPETPYVARGFTNLLERRDTVLLDLLRNASTPKVAAFFSECVDMEARTTWDRCRSSRGSSDRVDPLDRVALRRGGADARLRDAAAVDDRDQRRRGQPRRAYQAELMVSGLGAPLRLALRRRCRRPASTRRTRRTSRRCSSSPAPPAAPARPPWWSRRGRWRRSSTSCSSSTSSRDRSPAAATPPAASSPPGGGQGQGGGQGGGVGDPPSIPEIPVQRSAPTKPQLPTTATDAPRPPSRMSPAEVRAALDALLPTDAAGVGPTRHLGPRDNLAALAASVSPHLQLTPIADASAGRRRRRRHCATRHRTPYRTPSAAPPTGAAARAGLRGSGGGSPAPTAAPPAPPPRPPPAGRRRRRRRRRSSTEEGLPKCGCK